MPGRYKPYSEYKNSGIEWLGDIPKSWKLCRLKYMAKIKNGQDYKSIEVDDGYPVIGSGGQFTYASQFTYDQESVLLGRKGTIDKPLYINEPFWTVDTMYYTEINKDIPPKYLYYLALTIQFGRYSTNTALPSMTQEHLGNYIFATPYEKSEKSAIANFLDHETAKIDTLIEKQQQLIQLLKEKRQSVISHAVTKGLNSNAKMRDSGIAWLGEIPEHWSVKRIGLLFTESSSRAFSEVELEYPVLSVSIHHGISDKELNEEELDRKVARSEDRSLYKIVHRNYLIYNMMRAWQGSFGASKLSGLVSPAYVVCQPTTSLNSYYFELVLRTQNAIVETKRYSRGITDFRLRLYWDEFKNICVPIPGSTEINEILNYISKVNSTYDNLIIVAGRQIELLQEHRTALISAAVTGKIDVRNWVAQKNSQTNKEVAA
ncbi:type I restriction enzyme S subunit [Pseudomonas sp. PvP027]|uniref:restriction endonuclease subunit S n=1 Tax=Pseudomonas TaxID=286 RepID=UPI0016560AD0|nr:MULTISPECIES: restriction endonuclease subunit S [Pseudomonas]MBC8799545.1 restriction endonuclease subunit S [Pseudomonas congelans]MBP1145251.1 type I restriction enzyme S subunit [Pseudomonas sp. PvP027]